MKSNKKSSHLQSVLKVAFSLCVSLISGVVVGLLLPELFSITGYGYFKIYTLYVVYTALLHLGFVDGILLRYAGKTYEELDTSKMRMYTRFFFGFQGVFGLIMIVVGACLTRSVYGFIVAMLGVNTVLVNATTYYQFISQATQRFAEYSARNVIASLLRIGFVAVLCAVHWLYSQEISYKVYIIGLNVIDAIMLVGYMWIYRDITFGKAARLTAHFSDMLNIFKIGILLTIAYQISHLILALDRQFVSILFPTETYAVYSFAYNIVSMITTVISSLSIVMLPVLKKLTQEHAATYYQSIIGCVGVLAAASLLCYFPLTEFIAWYLPEYTKALSYLQIILPALLYHAVISVVMFTFCKIFDRNFRFFLHGCVVLVIGFITNLAAYLVWRTPEAISYASLVTLVVWFVIENIHLHAVLDRWAWKAFVYITVLAAVFWLCVQFIASPWIGMAVYAVAVACITMAMCREELAFLAKRFLKRSFEKQ